MNYAVAVFTWVVMLLSTYISVYYMLMLIDMKPRNGRRARYPKVAIAIPAFNEERGVARTLESILNLDYDLGKLQVFVVDDGSKDRTSKEARRFSRQHPELDITILRNRSNKGKAYSLNRALKKTDATFFVTMDADSNVHPSALKAMLRYSKGSSVVTPCVLPRSPKNIFERLQQVEYVYGNYLANILSNFDAQLVAPGPFSLFRTSDLKAVGGFDETSITEDLEVVYRLRAKGHKITMAPNAYVYTEVPGGIRGLIRQRKRWHLGFFDAVGKHPQGLKPSTEFGMQNILKMIYFFLAISFLLLAGRNLYRLLKPAFNFMQYVGFDIFPYLTGWQFRFDLLSLDIQMLLYFIIILIFTIIFLILASRFQDSRIGFFDAVLFMFAYGLALSTATFLAVYSWLKGDYVW